MTTENELEFFLSQINETLGLDLQRTYQGSEFKGVKIDHEDGGTCKFYLDSSDCDNLVKAFSKLAETLREPR